MKEPIRLDEVSVFGGKLRFLIPHDWEEADRDEDVYMYCRPNSDSGWFRVSLNTATVSDGPPAQTLKRIFVDRNKAVLDEKTGNWVYAFQYDTEEDGVKIRIYYWAVATVLDPDLIREAIFSYTVLSERINDEDTARTVELLEQIAKRANFHTDTQSSNGADS